MNRFDQFLFDPVNIRDHALNVFDDRHCGVASIIDHIIGKVSQVVSDDNVVDGAWQLLLKDKIVNLSIGNQDLQLFVAPSLGRRGKPMAIDALAGSIILAPLRSARL